MLPEISVSGMDLAQPPSSATVKSKSTTNVVMPRCLFQGIRDVCVITFLNDLNLLETCYFCPKTIWITARSTINDIINKIFPNGQKRLPLFLLPDLWERYIL